MAGHHLRIEGKWLCWNLWVRRCSHGDLWRTGALCPCGGFVHAGMVVFRVLGVRTFFADAVGGLCVPSVVVLPRVEVVFSSQVEGE